ncbi:hypothetical protein [Streptomyces sp. NPDC048392]|uniref:hypothetical protein n=1 Tax=Streptomyces sp. NPDC048392 TaxID=3365543 RepID=UPI00371C8FBB
MAAGPVHERPDADELSPPDAPRIARRAGRDNARRAAGRPAARRLSGVERVTVPERRPGSRNG